MPLKTIAEFEKSFPQVKDLSDAKKRAALKVFNTATSGGDDDKTAIKKALGVAKKMKEPKEMSDRRVMSTILFGESDVALEKREFQVLKTGEFFDPRYGKFKIDRARLEELKQNFDKNVLEVDVALDTNHNPEKGAFAWINSLEVKELDEGGVGLFATFRDFTEEGKKFFKEKVFRYFSVEFEPFKKVVGGKLKTFSNVLRGIALTNRPVIKGMQPTFLSEDINNSFEKTYNMGILLKLAEDMLKRDNVSKDDAAFLRAQFDEAPEEEQTDEAKEKVEEVEAKAEESADADPEPKGDEPEGADKNGAEGDEDGDEPAEEPEAGAMSESAMKTKLAERDARIEKLELAEKQRETEKRVEALTLSEERGVSVGFTKKFGESVASFVSELTPKQFTAFSELIKNVTNASMLLSENGHSNSVEPDEGSDEDKALKLAEKLLSEGKAKDIGEAQKMAFAELNITP